MTVRLLLAILLPFIACGVQWLLWDAYIKPYVWFLFFPAAFFSAWLGGLRGGMIGTVIGALLVWYFYIPPQFSFTLTQWAAGASILLFVIMGGLFAWVFERLALAQQRTDAALAETRAANEKITELYQKTLELDELKSQFFANVSHELRTPLTLIMAPLERRLAAARQAGEIDLEVEMMLRNARLLYRHVTDLLDAAKLEAGGMTLNWARLDLAVLTRTIASHFESLARERGIDYPVIAPETLLAEGDGEKLQRVLLNLLANAFKFTPDGGRIEVRLSAQDNQTLLEVADNGPGVPAGMRKVVFERFRQVEGGSQRRHGGTGLGLAIVKDFVELHGGTVGLDEAPGGGALFSLRLPLTAPAGSVLAAPTTLDAVIDRQAVEELQSCTPAPVACATPDGAAPLILVVEDNADMREFIAASLRPHYRVATAGDGRDGLAQALALAPDLIVSDVMMPEMSGDEMVLELRQRPEMAGVPIVMLTAKADETLRVKLLREGVQGYLNKPFNVEELLARVGGLLAERRRTREQLRLSEVRFEATFEQAAVGIALVAPDGHWLRVNRKLCEIVGYSEAELLSTTFQDITHPDDLDADLGQLRRMLAQEIDSYAMEKRYLRKDGGIVWIKLSVALVWKLDGTPDYFISVVEDIQARKEAELALQASEANLREAKRLAGLGHWKWDITKDSHFWSEEIYAIYGRDPALPPAVYPEVEGYFTPESWAHLAAAVEQCLSVGASYEYEAEVVRTDGEHRWIVARGEAARDAAGTIVELRGTVQDITARKAAEAALRDSERRFRRLFQEAPLPLCYVDKNGLLADRNQRFDQTFGYTHEELRSLDDWWPLAYPDPAYRAWVLDTWNAAVADAVAENRDIEPIEYRVCCKNGDTRTLLVSGIAVGEDFLATFYDVTERRQAEEALRELNASLERRVTERTAELSAANQELDAFAYAVSHDLRAPLRAMSGFAQALEEDFSGQLHGEAKTYLEQISLASRKMSELIDGILSLSRSTRVEMRRDPVDLGEMATRLLQQLAQAEPGRHVAVEVADGLLARGDARMLEAALANLLGNAWKYTARAAGAQIRVYAEDRDDGRWFCVADNGAGFDMAHAERLFKPFQRLHRQEEFPGIGIGLATVQRIIQRHGGRIEAHGEVGKGAVFCFNLGAEGGSQA